MGESVVSVASCLISASCIVCDRPENFDNLNDFYKDTPVDVVRNGHLVSRKADFIIYSVEAEFIDRVVAEYGACK